MKNIIIILASVLFLMSCGCGCREPKVIINNEIPEGIVVYTEFTQYSKYKIIEIVDNGDKTSHLLDGNVAREYYVGDTIKHLINYIKN